MTKSGEIMAMCYGGVRQRAKSNIPYVLPEDSDLATVLRNIF